MRSLVAIGLFLLSLAAAPVSATISSAEVSAYAAKCRSFHLIHGYKSYNCIDFDADADADSDAVDDMISASDISESAMDAQSESDTDAILSASTVAQAAHDRKCRSFHLIHGYKSYACIDDDTDEEAADSMLATASPSEAQAEADSEAIAAAATPEEAMRKCRSFSLWHGYTSWACVEETSNEENDEVLLADVQSNHEERRHKHQHQRQHHPRRHHRSGRKHGERYALKRLQHRLDRLLRTIRKAERED